MLRLWGILRTLVIKSVLPGKRGQCHKKWSIQPSTHPEKDLLHLDQLNKHLSGTADALIASHCFSVKRRFRSSWWRWVWEPLVNFSARSARCRRRQGHSGENMSLSDTPRSLVPTSPAGYCVICPGVYQMRVSSLNLGSKGEKIDCL